jgi:hypothetical protein
MCVAHLLGSLLAGASLRIWKRMYMSFILFFMTGLSSTQHPRQLRINTEQEAPIPPSLMLENFSVMAVYVSLAISAAVFSGG